MLGKLLLSALVAEGSTSAYLKLGKIEHLFKASEVDTFGFIHDFVKKNGQLPKFETIEKHTGDALKPPPEPHSYYLELMERRHVEGMLKQGWMKVKDHLDPDHKDEAAALQAMTQVVMDLVMSKNQTKIADFRDAYDVVVPEYIQKWTYGSEGALKFGWPYLDEMSGGFTYGDLISFVGRPQRGKTFQMLYSAMHGWSAAGNASTVEQQAMGDQSRMFVSMEMNLQAIQQRMAAMQTHVPAGDLKKAAMSTFKLKQMKQGLTQVKGFAHPFWVVDGNLAATVEDIWMLARQLKPAAIFVDGAYLVKHPKEKDRYKRVAENADLMKSELAALAPTVCSWQFAKTASKKKKGEKITGDDIAYSDAIFQVSSVVLGLLEEDSVETLTQKVLELLKGRNGEVGSFRTNWNFTDMDFSQLEEVAVTDLQFE